MAKAAKAAKAVPAIPQASLQAIKDPQIRQVLTAIADGLAVRNGDVGNGDQAFLTVGDLTSDTSKARAVANALAEPLASGMNQPGTPAFNLANQLIDRILGLPEWQSLFARISLLDGPDGALGSVANLLLNEARKRGASITEVQTKIQNESESRAEDVKTITAALGDNAAAIQEEARARVKDGESTAEKITNLATSTGKSITGINDALTVKTNSDNALASAINTIWGKVGSNTALVQSGTQIVTNNVGGVATKFDQLQATVTDPVTGLVKTYATLRDDFKVTNDKVNGMSGTWSVKLDLNGYVSGLSLNAVADPSGNQRSNMLFNVDTFAIGAPGHPEAVPFAIDAKTGLVSIKGNLVAEGSITGRQIAAVSVDRSKIALKAIGGAQIDDLAVDTLKIAGNSVIVGTYDEGGSNQVNSGSTILISRTINLGDNYSSGLIVNGCISLTSQENNSAGFRFYINGVRVGDQRVGLQGGWTYLVPATGFGGARAGTVTVTLEAYFLEKPYYIYSSTMSVIGGKR
jgi:hypothetical protein